jgi:hypothetical protein
MNFPRLYVDYTPSCILEQALANASVDDVTDDIWSYLVQQTIDQDESYHQIHGTTGHDYVTRGCQAPEISVESGSTSALKILLRYQCFIDVVQTERWTWHAAFENHSSHPDIIAVLLEHGAITERTLVSAVETKNYADVEILLSNGLDPNAESVFHSNSTTPPPWNDTHMTPLHFSERIQDDALIALLHRFGAKIIPDIPTEQSSAHAPSRIENAVHLPLKKD